MITLGAAIIVAFVLLILLVGSVVVTFLDRRRRAQHAANLEAATEAERQWPFTNLPQHGDTLTLVGTELVHRRCADARRDGRAPGQCCAARLEVS